MRIVSRWINTNLDALNFRFAHNPPLPHAHGREVADGFLNELAEPFDLSRRELDFGGLVITDTQRLRHAHDERRFGMEADFDSLQTVVSGLANEVQLGWKVRQSGTER